MGEFNLYNLLAAYGAVRLASGAEAGAVCAALAEFAGVEGRVEVVSREPLVVVDFAHTPDGIEKVLGSLAAHELVVVFGAGGNRDKSKRPKMGAAVAARARVAVVTSDNPRDEEPLEIIAQIRAGMGAGAIKSSFKETSPTASASLVLADFDGVATRVARGDKTRENECGAARETSAKCNKTRCETNNDELAKTAKVAKTSADFGFFTQNGCDVGELVLGEIGEFGGGSEALQGEISQNPATQNAILRNQISQNAPHTAPNSNLAHTAHKNAPQTSRENSAGDNAAQTTPATHKTPAQKCEIFIEPDRFAAIKLALSLATDGSAVVILGKGDEDYQEVRGVKHHFSDKEAVLQLLAAR